MTDVSSSVWVHKLHLAALLSAAAEFSFDSDSVVRFQLRGGGSSRRTNIQLLLRTRATSGTLLSVTSREANEYIVLEVSDQ